MVDNGAKSVSQREIHEDMEVITVDIEKLGAFYLGKELDQKTGNLSNTPILYDARDLTTHGVVVGMTGSGKTGLCIDMIEEAALDSVPAIIVDPKGDITNLLLTFPELRPEDFKPWVNVDDARRKGLSIDEYAQKVAGLWRNGLAQWDEGPERIRALKESAEFLIFTPGSDAGLPVSVLSSLKAPKLDWENNQETLQEQISGTVSALLGLAGIDADPVRSREHILLSLIFEESWKQGRDLDIGTIIKSVQNPPMRQIGVFDVDTFYPPKERFNLAMSLNGIAASPAFRSWLNGQPLDIPSLLHSPEGKPRISIFYIAHLNDAERMFFVTLLLEQLLTWVRTLSGTTSLRAMLYFDEVFGFFPPTANPPSKKPLLTLMKQARAFGLGVLLATQNPVDVDYKGLTNAGTWFIGRLQAQRDKDRLLDGLEQAAAEGGQTLNRSDINKIVSGLQSRQFFMHNVHDEQPVVFNTRWAMSYLRGPLTRQQIKVLMTPVKKQVGTDFAGTGEATTSDLAAPTTDETGLLLTPPSIVRSIPQVYLPVDISLQKAKAKLEAKLGTTLTYKEAFLLYQPYVIANGVVHYVNTRRDVDAEEEVTLLLPPPESRIAAIWEDATPVKLDMDTLLARPEAEKARFMSVPEAINEPKEFTALRKSFAEYLYRHKRYQIWYNPGLKMYSQQGESRQAFYARAKQAAREARDAAVDKLSEQYQAKIDRIQDRMEREKRDLEESEAKVKSLSTEQWASVGETALGFLLGRRSTRVVSGTLRKRRMVQTAKASVEESKAELADLQADLKALQEEMKEKAKAITDQWVSVLKDIQPYQVAPRRRDIVVQKVSLAWYPHWHLTYVDDRDEQRSENCPASLVGSAT